MHNKEEITKRVINVFANSFNMDESKVKISDTKKDIELWDSIGHLHLIMNIELEFEIRLSVDEINGINSVENCIKIINKSLDGN